MDQVSGSRPVKGFWDKAAEIDDNIVFHKGAKPFVIDAKESEFLGKRTIGMPEWHEMGYDRCSIFKDPMFVDAENENFDLKEGSPALAIGFQQIDVSKIGIRPQK